MALFELQAGVFLLNLGEPVKRDYDNEQKFGRRANTQINSDVALTKIVVDACMEFMTSDQISAGLHTREATLELIIGQFFRTDRVQKLFRMVWVACGVESGRPLGATGARCHA